ncbi:hypothetical protein I5R11_19080 [Serratia marcescens]|nr:hypothetical protein [Serratia marcescens]
MDKLREEFEEWFSKKYPLKRPSARKLKLWEAWRDSRASIVVELPKPHAHLIWIQAGYAPDDYWDDVEVSRSEKDKCCDGSDRYPVYAEHEIAESLRSIGLSIKGE